MSAATADFGLSTQVSWSGMSICPQHLPVADLLATEM
jgi:hypothetical protein